MTSPREGEERCQPRDRDEQGNSPALDDRLALPDRYTDHHAEAINAGVRAVKLDPCTVVMAMGMATTRLGLGATYSTTYYEPYHVARVFATMDLMLKGRVAWNIVTSLNSGEALNFGGEKHLEHDTRCV